MSPGPILHLTRDFPPRSAGGLSTAVGALVTTAEQIHPGSQVVLSFDGWRPTRTPSGRATAEPDSAASPICPGLNPPRVFRVFRILGPADLPEAAAFAHTPRPRLVHVHHAMLADFGLELAVSLGIPVVYTAHVVQYQLSALRGLSEPTLSDQAEARIFERATAISTPTMAAATSLSQHLPKRSDTIAVTRLGTALAPRTAPHSGPPHLVHIGRFDVLKGTDTLLDALPGLLALDPTLRITIAGGLPENAKAERRWRTRFASSVESSGGRVELQGWLDAESVARTLADATCFIAPSRAETCGLSLLEAVAVGVPIVASDLAPHREIAPRATFFPAGDAEALVSAVREMLVTPPGDSSAARATQPPDWHMVLPDWIHFWEKWR